MTRLIINEIAAMMISASMTEASVVLISLRPKRELSYLNSCFES